MNPLAGDNVAKKSEVSVKLDAELYRLVKTVASWREVGVTDYLNSIVEPAVKKDVAKMHKEMGQQADKE